MSSVIFLTFKLFTVNLAVPSNISNSYNTGEIISNGYGNGTSYIGGLCTDANSITNIIKEFAIEFHNQKLNNTLFSIEKEFPNGESLKNVEERKDSIKKSLFLTFILIFL